MPGLVRKLAIIAAVDGLILQPVSQRNQRAPSAIRIDYQTRHITALEPEAKEQNRTFASIEALGIVGLLTVSSTSYLISISGRQQVAQVWGKPIYVITEVAFIPLSSQSDADNAFAQTKASMNKHGDDNKAGFSDTSDDEDLHDTVLEDEDPTRPTTPERPLASTPGTPRSVGKRSTSVAEDVIEKKGQYGRFADRWFSKKGWSIEKRRRQGMSTADDSESLHELPLQTGDPNNFTDAGSGTRGGVGAAPSPVKHKVDDAGHEATGEVVASMLPKLIKTTKMMLGARSFYFSYDYDITRRLGDQDDRLSDMSLHKRVDPLFFWNRHLMMPFIDSGVHHFVLPLMQGFVGQRTFTANASSTQHTTQPAGAQGDSGNAIELENIGAHAETQTPPNPSRDFLLTLISRRSIKRPGLRYLRRGIDDNGDTANSVETEQILSSPSWSSADKIYSFTQIRGSIPLYFSQSPYSFKPAPVLQHSPATNHAAFKRHMAQISGRYGGIQIVSLVNKHGVEAKIGEEYQNHVEQLNEEGGINRTKIGFEWFDFHSICRGMKFENVSILMQTLGAQLDQYGATISADGHVQTKQHGVLRTNCMDCLDRTNVVQSACGQRALEHHLAAEGHPTSLQADRTTAWFNTLWADNGDAISKQYSSTAALKGDYTRTRTRNYRGALTDLGLSLSRYYNNVVNDDFAQAALDFLLGAVPADVFADFALHLSSRDPAVSVRRLRQNAIDTSAALVVADQTEDLVGGWTLLAPHEPDTLRSLPFLEVVLLLTDAALYAVRFDWDTEKVARFERVDLRAVRGLRCGTYVTSTLAPSQTDGARNVGFVLRYSPGRSEDGVRVNTRALTSALDRDDAGRGSLPDGGTEDATPAAAAAAAADAATPSKASPSPPSPSASQSTSTASAPPPTKILAFKALPARSSQARSADASGQESPPVVSEMDLVRGICEEIERACLAGGQRTEGWEGDGEGEGRGGMVEEGEIISVAEARRSTGLLEVWGHELKKLVWA